MKRLVGVLALILAGGCVPLTPYSTVRDRLPADSLIEVNGRLAHVVRSGSGEPVILLHGFGASAFSWRHVMAALQTEQALTAIDLNGFGYTERPRRAAGYTVAGQLALVIGVMDALGIDSAHVAGHSYGGAIALHLAWRHPERVRSVTLIDSAALSYPWDRRSRSAAVGPISHLFVRGRAIKRDSIRAGLERSFADDSQITPELVDEYYERLRIEGISRAFRGLTRPTPEPRELPDLTWFELPVLMVWGAQDEISLPEDGRAAAELIPNSEFELIDGAGHIPLEESPARLADLMRAFLERNRSASSPPASPSDE